ncbi:Uncharacterised protein [Mycobacteroides abscessus subsp. massiliense]|uniref:hypothetical protein n=1 Tax=Mycobacteroides abscessus TaxID=36809 RepID=UPI0009A6000A|nr:hypothetical protein [Mycobacteroides abscessus]SKY31807.1 Uncharacterised protein [Mycobacteroides abscessus subsp. massiliense]SKY73046.1 Uncharacterised protein [Mycobacteroides abscessus subsp. massiliense]
MKYTSNTIFKALGAFGVAFAGAVATVAQGGDLAALDLGGWLTAIGSGVVAAAAVFSHPVKADGANATANVGTSLADAISQADAVGTHLRSISDEAAGKVADLGSVAVAAIDQIQKAIGQNRTETSTVASPPVAEPYQGSLIDQVIRSATR